MLSAQVLKIIFDLYSDTLLHMFLCIFHRRGLHITTQYLTSWRAQVSLKDCDCVVVLMIIKLKGTDSTEQVRRSLESSQTSIQV